MLKPCCHTQRSLTIIASLWEQINKKHKDDMLRITMTEGVNLSFNITLFRNHKFQ